MVFHCQSEHVVIIFDSFWKMDPNKKFNQDKNF